MTIPFANIFHRPGPSAILSLGPDLYHPMPHWTTNTLLDSFCPRPEDGTILGPRLIKGPEGASLQVVRFDRDSARHLASSMKTLLEHWHEANSDDPVRQATVGRWNTRFYRKDEELVLTGPSRRFIRISSSRLQRAIDETRITVGRGGLSSGATQEVRFFLGCACTYCYSFFFRDQALEGLKAALGFQNLIPEMVALGVCSLVFDSEQYPRKWRLPTEIMLRDYDFVIRGRTSDTSSVSITGDSNLLKVDLHASRTFMSLRPALREKLWDGALAFLGREEE